MSCINIASTIENGNCVRRNAAKLPNELTDFFLTVGQKLAVNVLDFCFDCYFFFHFFTIQDSTYTVYVPILTIMILTLFTLQILKLRYQHYLQFDTYTVSMTRHNTIVTLSTLTRTHTCTRAHSGARLLARALIQSLIITHVFNRLHAHTQQWLHTHTAVGKKKKTKRSHKVLNARMLTSQTQKKRDNGISRFVPV